MATLTRAQVANYAASAGFSGNALSVAVAIAQAESSFNTAASHTNNDGSIDRGLWQINNKYHPEISDSQAYAPATAAIAAYAISVQGANFNAWSTYTSGAYKAYMNSSSSSTSGTAGRINFPWLQYPITHGYITQYIPSQWDTPHYADDMGMPLHTQITSMVNGKVRIANYQPWGGQVFITNAAGGPDWYVYHLDLLQINVGDTVSIGQNIGLSGGQNTGGFHPVSTMYSTGPHTHVGWFTKYVTIPTGAVAPYGPDISPLLNSLKTNGATGGIVESTLAYTTGASPATFTPLLDQVHQTLIDTPGFLGIAQALDEAERFPGYINLATGSFDVIGIIRSVGASIGDNFVPFLMRSGLFLLGFMIVLLLIIRATAGATEQVASKLGPIAAML